MNRRNLIKLLAFLPFVGAGISMDAKPKRQHPTFPMPKNPDWRYWDNYHRTMQRYEGFVEMDGGSNLWRFERISEVELKCVNCGAQIVVNREVMQSHGKVCNKPWLA